jgi:DNA-binding MarR family transcriptional regulator
VPLPFDPIAEARRQWEAHGWGEAAEGMAAVTSLMRAQQIVQARVDEALRPLALTFARYELLMLLHFSRGGALPVTKASLRLQVHPTSVTNAVDRLEQAGLVVRLPHPTDGRGTLVQITPEGRELALQATQRLNEQVFARPGLPPRRLAGLLAALTELRRTAGDFGTPQQRVNAKEPAASGRRRSRSQA